MRILKKLFKYQDIGWKEHGETFYRYTILKTKLFTIYLHQLDAPLMHPQCHDHPWHFWTIILSGGYLERTDKNEIWRHPGTILYRNAKHTHNVITKGTSWSLIITSHKVRSWGFINCGHN
jgi:hypothetical protein